MSKDNLKLNQLEMLDYYKNFDSISFKYRVLLECVHNGDDKLDSYLNLQKYENEKQFAELTRKEFWNLQENLDMSYSNRKLTDYFIQIFDIVCEKIIQNYIHIDGMERLFSEKYSEFEWEMHLKIDYEKHSMDFYRDHFIHQVKDAYSMAMLLENGGFYKKIHDILSNEGSGKIARYVNKLIGQQLRLPYPPVLFPEDLSEKQKSELLREHYMHNIIYISSYIAGLFHDIGYPGSTALENSQKVVDYLVEMHHFQQNGYDFRQIMSLLQNSLLFRIVSPQEIRSRMEQAKVDHGTMSALLLLLHFYENGAIHRLEPYKLCAVELAALAIYNHTNKYIYVGDENAAYERQIFTLDPISYLLRICDDIQEWGRVYFEISDKSNIILCNCCHMPVIRREIEEDTNEYEGDEDAIYQCCCKISSEQENNWLFAPMFRYKQFPYRRIYSITVCREVEIIPYNKYNKYKIHIKYDLDRLLHIAYINPDYAKYRIKELAKLKHFFSRHDQIELVFLDYFVTSNIILIKSMIVGDFLEQQEQDDGNDVINFGLNETNGNMIDCESLYSVIKAKYMDLKKRYKETLYNVCIPSGFNSEEENVYMTKCKIYLCNTFSLYIFIYLLICLGKTINTDRYLKGKELGDELKKLLDRFLYEEKMLAFCSGKAKVLLKDCCTQAGRMFTCLDNYAYYPDSYFSTFHSEEILYSTVKRFTDAEQYCSMIDKNESTMQLDAYSDLYSIRELHKKLRS